MDSSGGEKDAAWSKQPIPEVSRLLCARSAPIRLDRSRETRPVAPPTPTRNVLWTSRCRPSGRGIGGLSDARVIREGPTIADVYIDISPFYGMAPATVSGCRSGGGDR